MAAAVRRLPRGVSRAGGASSAADRRRRAAAGLGRRRPAFHASGTMTATRKSSHEVLQWAAAQVPELVGGSADLAPSTLHRDRRRRRRRGGLTTTGATSTSGSASTRWARSSTGSTLHYLRGLRLDVPRVQRLHARLDPARGADGLPVDLRLHARLDRARRGRPDAPADRAAGGAAGDAGAASRQARRRQRDRARVALTRSRRPTSPTALVLSRQGLPTWNPAAIPDDAIERGAYVLRDSYRRAGPPELILIAHRDRGPHLRLEAADAARGGRDRDPRREHALHGDTSRPGRRAYREPVLPPPCRAACRVEAAATFGWHRWIGDAGRGDRDADVRRVRRPPAALYKHFGFTPEHVAGAAARVVERVKWRRRSKMSTATASKPPAEGAHRGGRQRLARPDPPLADRERRARADGRRGVAARRDRRTRRSSRRRSSARPTTTTDLRELAPRAARRARDLRPDRDQDVQLAADVLADVHRESNGRDGFVSLEVAARPRARHRGHRSSPRATTGRRSTART